MQQERNTRTTDTRTTYSISTWRTRPHDTHTHTKTQMKRKEKETSLGFRRHLVSWRHVSPRHTRTRRRKRQLRRQHSDDDERTGLHTTTNEPPRTTTVQPPPHHEQPVAQASGFVTNELQLLQLVHTPIAQASLIPPSACPHARLFINSSFSLSTRSSLH